jgi:hypothetical protein
MVNTITVKSVTAGETRISKSDLLQGAYRVWSENDNRDKTTEAYKETVQSLADFIYRAYKEGDSVPVPGLILVFINNEEHAIDIVDGAFRFDAIQFLVSQHPDVKSLIAQVKFVSNPYLIKDEKERDDYISDLIAFGLHSQTFQKDTLSVAHRLRRLFDLDPKKAGKKRRIGIKINMSEASVGQYAALFELPQSYQDLFYSKFAAMNTVRFAAENGITAEEMIDLYNREGSRSGVGSKGYKIEYRDIEEMIEFRSVQAATIEEKILENDEDYLKEADAHADTTNLESQLEDEDFEESFGDDEVLSTQHQSRDTASPKATKSKAPQSDRPSKGETKFARATAMSLEQEKKKNKALVIQALTRLQDSLPAIDDEESVTIELSVTDVKALRSFMYLVTG